MNRLLSPFPGDRIASRRFRQLQKTKKMLKKYRWKFDVENLDVLNEIVEQLHRKLTPPKGISNRNQLPLILRLHSRQINEIYVFVLTLQSFHDVDQIIEQSVINRVIYVYRQILSDIASNEEIFSEIHTPI